MNYKIIKKLPPIEEIIQQIPLPLDGHMQIMRDREEIKNILSGKDDRLIIVVGPCSAWPVEAVIEYARLLVELNHKLKDQLKIIMRVYIQKPRTTKGWVGPVNQPDPFAYPDIEEGIKYARSMMIKVIKMGLPIADEALFTHNAKIFLELLSWMAIGARSAEDQEHRIFASAVEIPVGLKNPTSGSISIAINSVIAAQHSHVAVFDGYEVETYGNPYAHLVLRGGNGSPNYGVSYLEDVNIKMKNNHIKNPAVIIDASHDNCIRNRKKDPLAQGDVVFETLESLKNKTELRKLVKGFMIESFLKSGRQDTENLSYEKIDMGGLSITDPCLGWDETKEFLSELNKFLKINRC